MIKRYDLILKKWIMGYWLGSTFKILAVMD